MERQAVGRRGRLWVGEADCRWKERLSITRQLAGLSKETVGTIEDVGGREAVDGQTT